MLRKLFLAVLAVLTLVMVAGAGTIYSYNGSYGKPKKEKEISRSTPKERIKVTQEFSYFSKGCEWTIYATYEVTRQGNVYSDWVLVEWYQESECD